MPSRFEILGALLFIGGVVGATYYFAFFKTSVPTGYGEIHNIGLLADRQTGLLFSGLVAAVGFALVVVLRKKVS